MKIDKIENDVRFFKNEKEFETWLRRNHQKPASVWLGFFKRALDKNSFSSIQAFDIAMRFGWSGNVVRGIDHLSYKVKFAPRKTGSAWSAANVKRFLQLRKAGSVHSAGERAFEARDKVKSRRMEQSLSGAQLKKFKANKVAWEFFKAQTASYQKYMQHWIVTAKKSETQERRLEELIQDSANGTKLKRIVEANEKIKTRFEPGKTPVEQGENLGFVAGVELRSVGIETLEQLKRIGWEQAFQKLVQMYPQRFTLNKVYALAGAVNDLKRRELDSEIKAECKELFAELKAFD